VILFSPRSRRLGALQLLIGESEFFSSNIEAEDSAAFGASGHGQLFK
jgi:hypothetical protein